MTSIFRRQGRCGHTVKYRDAYGHTRMKSFRLEAKAKEFAKTARSSGRTPYFKDWAAAWLKQVRTTLRWGTYVSYKWTMSRWWQPRLDSLRLEDITRRHIKAVLLEALDSGMTPRSVHSLHTSLSSCLGAAVDDELLNQNPARGVPKALRIHPRNSAAPVRAFTLAEARLFLGALDKHAPEWSTFFRLLALTGLRIGEGLALRWEDIDWNSSRIYVSRCSSRGRIDGTKTAKDRHVDAPATLLEDLRRREIAAKATALQTGKAQPFIFPGQHGRPYAQRYPQAAFKRLLSKVGLPGHHTPHGLRHTFARLQLEAGAPLKYVQQQLGHSGIGLTADLYGQWADLGSAAAAEHHAERLLSPQMSPLRERRNKTSKSRR